MKSDNKDVETQMLTSERNAYTSVGPHQEHGPRTGSFRGNDDDRMHEDEGGGGDVARSATLLAHLFSVPPKSAPKTGIYALPKQLLDRQDGADGEQDKILGMDPRYWIKDIDTGKVYTLEGTEEGETSTSLGPMQQSAHQFGSDIQISDVLSGQRLTLREFEETMGYTRVSEDEGRQMHLTPAPAVHENGFRWIRGAMAKIGLKSASMDRDGVPDGSSPFATSPKEDTRGLRLKVFTNRKNFKEFSDVRLVQSIYAHEGVIWVVKFSKTGKYLATAGQDGTVAVWLVNVKRGLDNTKESEENNSGFSNQQQGDSLGQEHEEAPGTIHGVPVLRTTPYRVYKGHKKDVLDLAWSNSNFLFSASMDKSVRLWHVSVGDCLKVFRYVVVLRSVCM